MTTHILFITPFYPPEKGAAAARISETAVCLVRSGYQVTVLTTFPNYPIGRVLPGYRGHRILIEWLDGVRIVRTWSYTSPDKRFLQRGLAQLSFGCLAPVLGWRAIGHPDLVIAQSPPLFDAIAARILARFKRAPFIFMISDLWPEVAVQLGALRNGLALRLMQWLEWSTYRRASLVWTLTQGIHNTLIQRGLSPERVLFLPNGVDTDKFYPQGQNEARTQLGWDDGFTVLYAGTFGLVYALSTLLEAAHLLRNEKDIRFVFVGEGITRAELMQQAVLKQLENVVFLDAQPHDRMPLIYAAADVCAIPVRNMPMASSTLPAKMFEIMACARPVLLGLDGEARRLAVENADAALYVEPESAPALVEAILELQAHPAMCEAMGKRGRAFIEAHFDRNKLIRSLEERISRLTGISAPASVELPETASARR